MADENIQTSVGASQQEVAAQLATASSLDAKLMGVLGFGAAVGGVMLTVTRGLANDRWILFVGAVVMIATSLVGMAAEDLESGPNALEFYKTYGGASSAAFAEQLLTDLGASVTANAARIENRRRLLGSSLLWGFLGASIYGIVRLI